MVSVSIIIPAYNSAKYLPACLDSCLNQTFEDYEVVVVNDGSTDNTIQIVDAYIKSDARVSIITKENEGLVLARRSGIARAKGRFVFFIDADDIIEPKTLELLYSQSATNDIVIGNFLLEDETGKKLQIQHKNCLKYGGNNLGMFRNYLEKLVTASLCGRLIKKELLEDVLTPSSATIGEDVITNFLILDKHKVQVAVIDDFLYHYIQRTGSMANSYNISTLLKRASYIKWMYHFIDQLKILQDRSSLCIFILNEYYAFLRDGGNRIEDKELSSIVYINCWDKYLIRKMSFWKSGMLYSYYYSRFLGNFYRFVFLLIKKMI